MADLRVDDEAMKALIAKSIIDNLTPEYQEKLLSNAVTYLLTKNPDGYSRRAPIQQAFDDAVVRVSEQYARDLLANDEAFQAKIKQLFADVSEKLFLADKREELISNICSLITHALHKSY